MLPGQPALTWMVRGLGSGGELVVSLRLGYSVLANFIEQGLVADLENGCRLLAIPVGLFESLGDRLCFGFILGRASQRFQTTRVGSLA